jgi:predicted RNA-binding Zn-ribbon protein involved in translation (DUF1610 family)
MEQLITLATFNELDKAEPLKEKFKAAGVWSEIYDESTAQKTWFLTGTPKAHIRLRVKKEDMENAEKLLKEWDGTDAVLKDAVRCPECGSSRIEYPQFSRRTGVTAGFALLAATGIIDRTYYCENCQFTWPDVPPQETNVNVLNWPKK